MSNFHTYIDECKNDILKKISEINSFRYEKLRYVIWIRECGKEYQIKYEDELLYYFIMETKFNVSVFDWSPELNDILSKKILYFIKKILRKSKIRYIKNNV